MKRPAFQFYPGDWQRNANLRRCTPAARGVWVDIMCLLHDSDEYGLLRWPLKEIAQAAGASLSHVRELVDKRVLKGVDKGPCEPFVYTPRSGRKDGEPITLIDTQAGPIWYSTRMVKDEYVRTIRGESTRFGDGNGDGHKSPNKAPKPPPNDSPKPPFGDGSSSASATAVNTKGALTNSLEAPAPCETAVRSPVEGQAPTPAHPAGPRHPPDPESPVLTMADAVVQGVAPHGFDGVSAADPRLLALLGQGASPAEVVGVAAEAATKGCSWAWVLKVVEGRRRDAAGITLAAVPELPWQETRSGIEGKGVELGIGRWDEMTEQWPTYLARVCRAVREVAEVDA